VSIVGPVESVSDEFEAVEVQGVNFTVTHNGWLRRYKSYCIRDEELISTHEGKRTRGWSLTPNQWCRMTQNRGVSTAVAAASPTG